MALLEGERLQGSTPNSFPLHVFVQTAQSKGYLLLARKASALVEKR
jgi:hypothetical protein